VPDANAAGTRLSTQELSRFEFALFSHFIHEKVDTLFRKLEFGGKPGGCERFSLVNRSRISSSTVLIQSSKRPFTSARINRNPVARRGEKSLSKIS